MKSFSFPLVRRAVAPLLVLVAGGLLMAPAHAVTTNLITNGSFETGDLTGFTRVAPYGDYSVSVWKAAPSQGEYAAIFNSGNQPAGGSISQTFATVVGKTYTVEFDYGMGSANYGVTDKLNVDFTGNAPQTASVTVLEGDQNKPIAYTPFSFSFVATSTSSTLTFTDDANNYSFDTDAALDNIRVSVANDAPVASDSSPATDEDTAVSSNLSASDNNEDTLTYSKVSDPANGSVVVNSDGTFTYTPNANFNGTDSFTFKANDGIADSNVGTVTITVNSVEDAPVVSDQNVYLDEDGTKTITIGASDGDGDALFFNVVSGPTHGTLDKTSGALVNGSLDVTYTPDANYNGPDTFQYTISDKGGLYFSGTGHYYQYVAAPGISWAAAQAAASSKQLFGQTGYLATITSEEENQFISGKLQGQGWLGGSDSAQEGTWNWVVGPEAGQNFWNGLSNGSAPANAYANWNPGEPNQFGAGEDYLMTIGTGNSVKWNDYDETGTNPSAPGLLNGYVIEYGGLTGETVSAPTANVNIFVYPVNDKPVGTPKSITINQDTVYNGNVSATDVEDSTLTYNVGATPVNGTLVFNTDGTFTYTPYAGFVGSDSFTFTATDSGIGPVNVANAGPGLSSDPVTVSITVKDTVKPAAFISSPAQNQKVMSNAFTGDVLSGIAFDNVEVTSVKVRLSRKRGTTNQYWNGTDFVAGQAWVNATLQSIDPTSVQVSTLPGRIVKWTIDGQLPSESKLDSGAYDVQVYAKDAAGNKSAYANSTFTIKKDVTAPTLSISTPTLGQKVLIENFTGSTVGGTTSDDVAVSAVKIRLSRKRGTTNQYWNGTDFVTTSAYVDGTIDGTSWSLGAKTPAAEKLDTGAYLIEVYAMDAVSNKSATAKVSFNLNSDYSAPSVSISSPTSSQVIKINEFGAGTIAGTASDNKGVSSVKVKLQRKRGTVISYWNGTSFVETAGTVDANYNSETGTWSLEGISASALDAGGYTVYATASDAAGNKTTSAARLFSVVGSATAGDASVSEAPSVSDKSAGSS